MSQTQPSRPTIFTQVDVAAGCVSSGGAGADDEQSALLRQVLAAQDRTNEILEELLTMMASNQKQRAAELRQWKTSNPELADSCRDAADSLSKVQLQYLERITDEIAESAEDLAEGEFMLNEFIDRFGPRLAHLNGVIQVLAQLGHSSKTLKGQS